MRIWTIANGPVGSRTGKGAESCGCCGRQVLNGTPIQVITITGVAKARYRCVDCAEGEIDWTQVDKAQLEIEARTAAETPELPARETVQPAKGFTKLSEAGKAFDPRMAAAGGDK